MSKEVDTAKKPLYTKIPLGIFSVALSGLIVFTVTTFYTDIYKQPSIDLSLTATKAHESPTHKYQITLKNDGRISATHLRLTLSSDSSLSNVTTALPIENMTSAREGIFPIVEIPRLAPGATYVLYSTIPSSAKPNIDYNIYTTYDQGSINKSYSIDTQTNKIIQKSTSSPLDFILTSPATVISTIITIAVAVAAALTGIFKKRYSQNKIFYTMPIQKRKVERFPFFVDTKSDPIDIQDFSFHANSKNIVETITSLPRLSIGIFGEAGTGKTTLMHCINGYLKPTVFTWDEVPGGDSIRLIEYIKTNFDFDWIDVRSNIKKKEYDKTLEISNSSKTISIRLDATKTKASLISQKINYYEFLVENGIVKENDILTIWFDAAQYERDERFVLELLISAIYYSIRDHPVYTDLQSLLNRYLNENTKEQKEKESAHNNYDSIVNRIRKIENEMHKIIARYPIARIVIFIDNIDKCSPRKVLEIFDSIKSFRGTDGFIFVLSITPEILSKMFQIKYEDFRIDDKYISDIIQISITIPNWRQDDIRELIQDLLSYQIDYPYKKIIYENINWIVQAVESNPLQVKRFLNDFTISNRIVSYGKNMTPKQILGIEILKSKWPDIYNIFKEFDHDFIRFIRGFTNMSEDQRRHIIRQDMLPVQYKMLEEYSTDNNLWYFLSEYVATYKNDA